MQIWAILTDRIRRIERGFSGDRGLCGGVHAERSAQRARAAAVADESHLEASGRRNKQPIDAAAKNPHLGFIERSGSGIPFTRIGPKDNKETTNQLGMGNLRATRDQRILECQTDLERLIARRAFYLERAARLQTTLQSSDLASLEQNFAILDVRIADLKDILATYQACVA